MNPCIECGTNCCLAQMEGKECKAMNYEARPHGEWIYKDMKGQFCSVCDKQSVWKFAFCPNCGASMVQKTCGNCYWFSKVTVPCCDKDCEPTTEDEKACDGWEEGEAE